MRRRIERYRRIPPAPPEDYRIGCILLAQSFFFDEPEWIELRVISLPIKQRSSNARRPKCLK